MLAWLAGFVVYAAAAQPPALVDHASWITNVPEWATKVGGTLPSFAVSFVLYLVLRLVVATAGSASHHDGPDSPAIVKR